MRSWNRWLGRALARGVAATCLLAGAGLVLAGEEAPPPGQPQPGQILLQPGEVTLGEAPPAAPKKEEPKKEEPKNPWAKVPPVRPQPRPGNFAIPPSGPGYYSLSDVVHQECRPAPPKFPYPPFGLMPLPFFDADFRYLDDPKNTQHDFFDPFKRVHLGDDWLFSTGGQLWNRHMHEVDSRLTARDNTYELFRVRTYGDLWYRDAFRLYAEFVYADTFNQDLPPLPIDSTRADMQNLFVDVKVAEIGDKPAYLRVGRQELLFGSQRLISPPDWANTRRTFNGARGFRQGEKFDVDLFWAQPVVPNRDRFDSVDNNQNFAGLWTTYRPEAGHFLDAYYLFLDNTNRRTQLGLNTAPYNVHTLGTRYAGDRDKTFLWDVEAALQLGERGDQSTVAGMFTAGAGYHPKDVPLNPTLWVYYDWASGDSDPGRGGSYNTFNQLYPFGHYYLGWLDLIGRQNIQDLNVHLYLYPTKWVTFITQYHHFWLDSSRDALYNVAGNPSRRDPTGRAGHNVGDEIDLILNFHLGPHSDVLVGYSKLFAGQFLERTGPAVSPELFYVQYSFRW